MFSNQADLNNSVLQIWRADHDDVPHTGDVDPKQHPVRREIQMNAALLAVDHHLIRCGQGGVIHGEWACVICPLASLSDEIRVGQPHRL